MQRYFIKKINISNEYIYIKDNDFHHIKNVMRMKVGDEIITIDEDGKIYLCTISFFQDKSVELRIEKEIIENNELSINVTIAQGLVRKEKKEEVIKRITELGATGYVSVKMEYINVKYYEDKLERLNTIVKEACEQCHRNKMLKVYETIDFKQFLSFSKDYDMLCYAYEKCSKTNDSTLKQLLRDFNGKRILFLVGPEGGISKKEVELLNQNGFIPIGLGPRILRTETAPLYIMSAVSYEREI